MDDPEELSSLIQYEGGNNENKDDVAQYEPKNYAFMDGLRGFGSFAVYLSHIHD